MPLIKNGQEIENTWTFYDDDQVVPETGDAVVSFSRLLDSERLCDHQGRVGVRVKGHDHIERLETLLPKLSLIEIEFPIFRDGRGYSTARLLRERFKYQGELRAVGDVLHDQLFFMVRCGFDSFLTPKAGAAEFAEAMKRFSVVYQPAADGRTPIGRVRAGTE
ncbi:MAG: DUF934 domain-containing protein [Caulobacterales bacterium]